MNDLDYALPTILLILPAGFTWVYLNGLGDFHMKYGLIQGSVIIPMSVAVGFLLMTVYVAIWWDLEKQIVRDLRNILLAWFPLGLLLTVATLTETIEFPLYESPKDIKNVLLIALGLWLLWGVFNVRALAHLDSMRHDLMNNPPYIIKFSVFCSWCAYFSLTLSSTFLTVLTGLTAGS